MATWLGSQETVLGIVFLLLSSPCFANVLRSCRFDAVYQLGDSISDTGNLIREDPSTPFARLPYALSAGISFLEPYLNRNAVFTRGVNFAVAGATALPVEVLAKNGVLAPVTNTSLSRQLDWMSTYFNSICLNNEDCAKKLEKALFMVGEIGGNDYNYALTEGKSFDEVRSMTPLIIQAIKDAVTKVVGYGATRVVVSGNFPIGCLPIYLTVFQSNDSNAYDEHHCLKDLNNLSIHYNNLLKQAIEELRNELPKANIVYGDYYNAYMKLLGKAESLGFETKSIQKACCGTGGDYNFNIVKMCGTPGVQSCPNPHQHISWDGVHSTQSAYKFMAKWLIRRIYPQLGCGAS
ncbi:hypothetical protein PTKIN_Ptkin09bG0196700 [Pterospermum kingtungense]